MVSIDRRSPRRVSLAASLSFVLLLALSTTAAAAFTPQHLYWEHGNTSCTDGDYLEVRSYANGEVRHHVDQVLVGAWSNGTMYRWNHGGGPSQNGLWEVYSWDGAEILSASAECDNDDPGPDPDPPPPHCPDPYDPRCPVDPI
jgi:hypothetical protein